jgi:hypothetical protein
MEKLVKKRIEILKDFCKLEIEKLENSSKKSRCTLLLKKNEDVIFNDLYFYEEEDLIKVIRKEVKYHLTAIEKMDSNYFAKSVYTEWYLNGPWKKLIERIRDSVEWEEKVLEFSIWD